MSKKENKTSKEIAAKELSSLHRGMKPLFLTASQKAVLEQTEEPKGKKSSSKKNISNE